MARTRERVPPALQRMALRVAKLRGRSKHEHALVLADAMDEAGWKDASIPTGRRGPPELYWIRSVDAWGNEEDGWEINDWRDAGELIVRPIELLHNVRVYRDEYVTGQRTTPADFGRRQVPLTHLISTSYFAGPVIRKEIAKHWLKPGVRFVLENIGDGFYEVSVSKTGEPLYQLEYDAEEPTRTRTSTTWSRR